MKHRLIAAKQNYFLVNNNVVGIFIQCKLSRNLRYQKNINNSISLLANNTNMNLNDKLITVEPLLILQRSVLICPHKQFRCTSWQ